MRRRIWTWGLVLVAVLVGCDQAGPDLEARRQALLEADSTWQAFASEGEDVDAILSYWAEDAVVYPPGRPALRGTESIREYVSSALDVPGFEISWTTQDAVMGPSGEMAYLTHTNEITAPDSEGDLVTSDGKGVTIWRRTAEGEWRNVIDIWNAASAPSDSM